MNQRIGRFELTDKGTLFLDEIGDMPLELQPKLLRVLQEREFERLGSSRTQKVDVRMVAATNQDLLDKVNEGEFRSDLYYRLNVFPIRIPPLRERKDDIPLLANHFAQKFAFKMGKEVLPTPVETLKVLRVLRLSRKCARTGKHHRTSRDFIRRRRFARRAFRFKHGTAKTKYGEQPNARRF
jgi:formate hydrogenlyase transcriptional activator